MLRYMLRNNYRALKSFFALQKQKKKQVFELTLNGGFGDIILDSQFLLALKEDYPQAKINVYYRDDEAVANPEDYSWGQTRHYTTSDGKTANPIAEWLGALHCVDKAIGCSIDGIERGIRVYPESFHKFFGGYWSPQKFNSKVNKQIFEEVQDNPTFVYYKELLLDNTAPLIALHLRRNSAKIIELATVIQQKNPSVKFILLGSSEHQTLPNTDTLINKISLIDSYSKGLSTLELLYLTKAANLFIGGRGGFELFHWLAETPTVCFFDEMGEREVRQLWWHRSLWQKNKISKLYFSKSEIDDVWKDIERSQVLK